jgi:hypothetical protein
MTGLIMKIIKIAGTKWTFRNGEKIRYKILNTYNTNLPVQNNSLNP